MKLTPWIDGSIKPTVEGVYQRKYHGEDFKYSMFRDGSWGCGWCGLTPYILSDLSISPYQDLPWRGLKEKPE